MVGTNQSPRNSVLALIVWCVGCNFFIEIDLLLWCWVCPHHFFYFLLFWVCYSYLLLISLILCAIERKATSFFPLHCWQLGVVSIVILQGRSMVSTNLG